MNPGREGGRGEGGGREGGGREGGGKDGNEGGRRNISTIHCKVFSFLTMSPGFPLGPCKPGEPLGP